MRVRVLCLVVVGVFLCAGLALFSGCGGSGGGGGGEDGVSIFRASVNSYGEQGDLESFWPSLSSDGSIVAFHSNAANLVSNDTNGTTDIFVRDRQTGRTARVDVTSSGGESVGNSYNACISADGSRVAFESYAPDIVPDDTNNSLDVFVAPNPLAP